MIIKHPFMRYWLPVCLLCAGIFLESCFAVPDLKDDWFILGWSHIDKVVHGLMYGVLSILVCRAFNSLKRWQWHWLLLMVWGIGLATLYGLSDEVHQAFVVARTADPADLLADFVGASLGAAGFVAWLRYLNPNPKNISQNK